MRSDEETIISPGGNRHQLLRDVWRYRELLLFLAWRDLLVRYKQTVVGLAWALIRPLLTMLVLTLVFGRFAKMSGGGVPYPLVVLCGLLPWQFFATVLSESGASLISNTSLISKVYFPRLIIPAGTVITASVDFVVSLAFLVLLMIWYEWTPPAAIVALPFFFLLACAASLGVGLWAAALMVEYRDVRHIVPFAVQFGLYISPVGYSSDAVPEYYRLLYSMNPMVGVIDGFRWCLLGGEHDIYGPGLTVSLIGGLFLLISGIWYFRRTERTFADVI